MTNFHIYTSPKCDDQILISIKVGAVNNSDKVNAFIKSHKNKKKLKSKRVVLKTSLRFEHLK